MPNVHDIIEGRQLLTEILLTQSDGSPEGKRWPDPLPPQVASDTTNMRILTLQYPDVIHEVLLDSTIQRVTLE